MVSYHDEYVSPLRLVFIRRHWIMQSLLHKIMLPQCKDLHLRINDKAAIAQDHFDTEFFTLDSSNSSSQQLHSLVQPIAMECKHGAMYMT